MPWRACEPTMLALLLTAPSRSREPYRVQGYDLNWLKFPPIDSWTEDSTGAEADAREWALFVGPGTKPRDPHRTRQIVLDLIALCSVVTVIFVAVFASLDAWTAATEIATTSAPAKPAAGDANSLPTNQGGYIKHLDAKTAVLSVDDLPDYRLVSSAEAIRPGGAVPNGWDNVFQKSHAGALDYRMAEVIVVVYGSTDEAIAGVDLLRQAEESQGAMVSPASAGSQATSWVEPLGIPGYEIVRVVFRTDNVVAQIAILGKDSPLLSDDVKAIVSTQQTRLAWLLQGNA
jgi:hypothetical protein